MHRRSFLQQLGLGAAAFSATGTRLLDADEAYREEAARQPAFSVVPVVGDGTWIWNKPPEDQTGYLQPRSYEAKVGIELEGRGRATDVMSTTTAPLEYPEQKIEDVRIETQGCRATLRKLEPHGGQLVLWAPGIQKGQKISAIAHFKLKLFKQYHQYEKDQFPAEQKIPNEVRDHFLQNSPGIETREGSVRRLAHQLSEGLKHPWDQAQAFAKWIPKHIRPQIGSYTSVKWAVENRRGDCEEMAGLFVAFCRIVGIPARLVWVPNHAWAEFYLVDRDGEGHWIPAHTACYFWFGWTGAHELVLQKGDRYYVEERHKRLRLLEDWTRYVGRGPKSTYTAELTPVAESEAADAGPGARRKDAKGEWKLVGDHRLNKYMRR